MQPSEYNEQDGIKSTLLETTLLGIPSFAL